MDQALVCLFEILISLFDDKYFIVKPETRECKVKLRAFNNAIFDKIKIPTFPLILVVQQQVINFRGKHWIT